MESHLRELLEQGFEVAVVKDGTAAAKLPDYDGYKAALVNYRFIANAVWTTEEVKQALSWPWLHGIAIWVVRQGRWQCFAERIAEEKFRGSRTSSLSPGAGVL